MRVLVTRPEPDAAATAARLEAAGHTAHRDALLIIEPVNEAVLPPGRLDALALTSVNGARALAARPELAVLSALPLFAVGRRTAAAAPAGFKAVHVAGGTGEALAGLLGSALTSGILSEEARVLHVCGEDRAVDLGAALAGRGIAVPLFVIYRARAAVRLSAATVAALRGRQIDAAFHFSPRTAATLAARAREANVADACGRIEHLCFSENVAAPLRAAGWPVRIAHAPTEEGLFALLSA